MTPERYQRYIVFKETLRNNATSLGVNNVFEDKSLKSVPYPLE
jgi:hypothetical protein